MTQVPSVPARAAALTAALAGFASLFMGAHLLSLDLTLPWGVTDETLRPVAHFAVYGTLAVLLACGSGLRYRAAWGIALALATLEELYQATVPGRICSVSDWAMNAAGITVCLLLARALAPVIAYQWQRRRYRRVLAAEGAWRPVGLPIRLGMMGAMVRRARGVVVHAGRRPRRTGRPPMPQQREPAPLELGDPWEWERPVTARAA